MLATALTVPVEYGQVVRIMVREREIEVAVIIHVAYDDITGTVAGSKRGTGSGSKATSAIAQ